MKPSHRAIILKSRALPILVFPYRLQLIVKYLFREGTLAGKWLFRSREFANFTYDLTAANKDYLAWFVAGICRVEITEIQAYFNELENDKDLSSYISDRLHTHRRGREIDDKAYFGRRIGWYALIRALKPNLVVETGTEKGLGSLVIAEALRRNGFGHLITIDVEPSSGLLIGAEYDNIVQRVVGDSLTSLEGIPTIDFFIHDSDHSPEHEAGEFAVLLTRLSTHGIVLSDNSHSTTELAKWSEQNGRKFSYFAEQPLRHWYKGAGIGISV